MQLINMASLKELVTESNSNLHVSRTCRRIIHFYANVVRPEYENIICTDSMLTNWDKIKWSKKLQRTAYQWIEAK